MQVWAAGRRPCIEQVGIPPGQAPPALRPGTPFLHQGSADLNTYKLFLEHSRAILRMGGRLGFVVPSGLYTDAGSRELRDTFLNKDAWELLFGFENRKEIFKIDTDLSSSSP